MDNGTFRSSDYYGSIKSGSVTGGNYGYSDNRSSFGGYMPPLARTNQSKIKLYNKQKAIPQWQ